MAEIKKFECRKCGWNIDAPKDGVDLLMDVFFACSVCKDCLGQGTLIRLSRSGSGDGSLIRLAR